MFCGPLLKPSGVPLPAAWSSAVLQLHADISFDFSGAESHQPMTCHLFLPPRRYLRSNGARWEPRSTPLSARPWLVPADGAWGWPWGTEGMDGPVLSCGGAVTDWWDLTHPSGSLLLAGTKLELVCPLAQAISHCRLHWLLCQSSSTM